LEFVETYNIKLEISYFGKYLTKYYEKWRNLFPVFNCVVVFPPMAFNPEKMAYISNKGA
jgi:hypothetical protein